MKKTFTFLFSICIMAISTAQTVSTVTITHINGTPKADFIAANSNLVEEATYTLTVDYKNIQANPAESSTYPNPRVRVRVLNNYAVIAEAVEGTVDVTTSETVQTVNVDLTLPNITSSYDPARLQALAYGTKSDLTQGMVFGYAATFTFNDLLPTAINDVKDESSACYYVSSKGIIVTDNTIEGDYTIYNISGVAVLKGKIESEINICTLSSGLYILSYKGGTLKFSK